MESFNISEGLIVENYQIFFAINLMWLLGKRHRTQLLSVHESNPRLHRFQFPTTQRLHNAAQLVGEMLPDMFVSAVIFFNR